MWQNIECFKGYKIVFDWYHILFFSNGDEVVLPYTKQINAVPEAPETLVVWAHVIRMTISQYICWKILFEMDWQTKIVHTAIFGDILKETEAESNLLRET